MKKIVYIMGFILLFTVLLSSNYSAMAQEYNGPANVTTVGGIRFYETDDTETTTSSDLSTSQEKETPNKPKGLSGKPRFPTTGEIKASSILIIGLVFVFIAFFGMINKRSK
ncbi:LPXTG-domain-containing protein cell wall anchor domain [Enterococcus moraviensis ATCC BAA-383]|uniref:LPXTG-domain-containing protein cell wall anchor domain n=1 Tax=Enterococcus moraviensis ATCC BAA-383 TaxID=1158609 RepID=R2TS79_9ENTE|nr:LPXTG cell wall anchor domain-containing protein [Enterococcus moraviensis]EOI03057.1 LPXTG-domain-containing protein cell wall anchor domain [Enterococcus moraviensis ATCC BAA-383]EOT74066.1 hypothetical protein I586_01062 [Enterococcus moraviensis ATCC BAA-383]